MAEWSRAFGGVPIFLHADDRAWVTRPDDAISSGRARRRDPLPGSGLTLIRCGGHFPGQLRAALAGRRRRARARCSPATRSRSSATGAG